MLALRTLGELIQARTHVLTPDMLTHRYERSPTTDTLSHIRHTCMHMHANIYTSIIVTNWALTLGHKNFNVAAVTV